MSSLTLDSVKDCSALVYELSRLFPVKQTRMRENLAKSIGFNSYNALIAKIKTSPIVFDLIDILKKLKEELYMRHHYTFEDDTQERLIVIFTRHCSNG